MLRSNFLPRLEKLNKEPDLLFFVNIGGLAVGIAVALLDRGQLWLHDELSFNTHHKNYDRIAKVSYQGTGPNGVWLHFNTVLSPGSIPVYRTIQGCFQTALCGQVGRDRRTLRGEKNILPRSIYGRRRPGPVLAKDTQGRPRWVDGPAFHSSFGSHRQSLIWGYSPDPIDRTMLIDNAISVKVTGVYEDLPLNTDLQHGPIYLAFCALD